MKIDGTDPLRLNIIQDQVRKPMVHRLGETDTENKIREKQDNDRSIPHDRRPYLEKLEQAIKQSNETADTLNLGIRFKLHESSERYMVQIVDRADNAVIKEIPPERVLNLVGQIQEIIGLLLDEKR